MSPYLRSLVTLLLLLNTGLIEAAAGGGASSEYYSIKPPFVVNVVDSDKVRHMQITAQLHATDSMQTQDLETHKPAIQHALIMLFSGKDVNSIKTVAGKEQLRKDALKAVQSMLKKNVGKPLIDEVYFTEFIIQ